MQDFSPPRKDKNKRTIFSNFLSKTIQDEKKNFNLLCNAKLADPVLTFNPSQTENSSQTSKTILELAKIDAGDISPDSLTSSPRYRLPVPKNRSRSVSPPHLLQLHLSEDPNFSLESVHFDRKHEIVDYITPTVNSIKHSTPPPPPSQAECVRPEYVPENLDLRGRFIQKARAHVEPVSLSTPSSRAQFLQQTSPLRKLMADNNTGQSLKSSSCVESGRTPFHLNPGGGRFRVKCVKENPKHDENYHSRINRIFQFSPNDDDFQTARSHDETPQPSTRAPRSFMSPTISSENKNLAPNVQEILKLIPPIRKGRSTSPKKISNHNSPNSKKLPYIDQSDWSSTSNVERAAESRSPRRIRKNKGHESPDIDNLDCFDDSASCESNDNFIVAPLRKLRSTDWNTATKGLAEIVDIARSVDTELIFPHMTTINQRLIELLRSPRSHVIRTAIQATGTLFEYVRDTRRPEFDDIVEILLCKTADANKFIKQEANKALDCIVTHVSPTQSIRAVCNKGPYHKHHLVRLATVRIIVCAVVIIEAQQLFNPNNNNEITRKRVVLVLALFLDDKNSDVRKCAERLYKILRKDSRFEVYVKKYLEKKDIDKMIKNLKYINITKGKR